jgi:hypothetical protein
MVDSNLNKVSFFSLFLGLISFFLAIVYVRKILNIDWNPVARMDFMLLFC